MLTKKNEIISHTTAESFSSRETAGASEKSRLTTESARNDNQLPSHMLT